MVDVCVGGVGVGVLLFGKIGGLNLGVVLFFVVVVKDVGDDEGYDYERYDDGCDLCCKGNFGVGGGGFSGWWGWDVGYCMSWIGWEGGGIVGVGGRKL